MKNIVFILVFIIIPSIIFAQRKEISASEQTLEFENITDAPIYPGCEKKSKLCKENAF